MSDSARRQIVPGTIPFYAWTSAVDVDLQTALALSRASAEAILALSPEGARALREKLEQEVAKLELHDTPEAEASARSLRQILDKAA